MVAKFYNDYRTTLNGNTTILGSLYCSQPIDAYRFTATEIRARDTTGIVLGTNNGTPSIKILDDSKVEIYNDVSISATRNNGENVLSRITNLGIGYASNF
jgi:hypothetical protein